MFTPHPALHTWACDVADRLSRGVGLTLCALLLTNPAGAADSPSQPGAVPPPDAAQAPPATASVIAPSLMRLVADLEKVASESVATVNGETITKGDVAETVRQLPASFAELGPQEVYRRALDGLVREKMLVAKAHKDGLDKDPVVIRRERAASDRVLATAWLDQAAERMITDQALRERYQREFAGKPPPPEVSVQVILVPTEQLANKLIGEIMAGAGFAEQARLYSQDPSAPAGGDRGYITLSAAAPEIRTALATLSPGEITKTPIQMPGGYLIVRDGGHRQRSEISFEEARFALWSELRGEKIAELLRALPTVVSRPSEAAPGQVKSGLGARN